MTGEEFRGFPSRTQYTPLPNQFFSSVLPRLDDITELKLILHVFWLIYPKKGFPRFVTFNELSQDTRLRKSLGCDGSKYTVSLSRALDAAVRDGILLKLSLSKQEREEMLLFINDESSKRAIERIRSGAVPLGDMTPAPEEPQTGDKPNIFSLYEQNIGMLTPLIVEQLKDAENHYPADWIEEAFEEAVSRNRRNWTYVAQLLELWATEGKGHGKLRRDTEKTAGADKYVRGKYGRIVQR